MNILLISSCCPIETILWILFSEHIDDADRTRTGHNSQSFQNDEKSGISSRIVLCSNVRPHITEKVLPVAFNNNTISVTQPVSYNGNFLDSCIFLCKSSDPIKAGLGLRYNEWV